MATPARFAFGANWQRFARLVDEPRIAEAQASLAALLATDDLRNRSFLDVGSGSGLSSLVARRLGARVRSFDYDADSVACTAALRERFAPGDAEWLVERGSALDAAYLERLGVYDVVYAWGVLHHTGAMWRAFELAAGRVAPGGVFCVALYNDQGRASERWRAVKRLYNALPPALRFVVLGPAALRLWGPTMVRDLARGRPFASWREYVRKRGMSPWRDVVDWVGGYPFDVAAPERVVERALALGLALDRSRTCGRGHGCNEFVFRGPAGP